jgi:hypothetical protein
MEGGARVVKPSKAEQSSLEARSVCEEDKIVECVEQEADATTFAESENTFDDCVLKKARGLARWS